MTDNNLKLNLRTVPIGRPEWGAPAALVVPLLEHQEKWGKQIKPGSALVAYMNDQKTYTLYYEGNMFNAENIRTFSERALHAYGRMTKSYPTVAKSIADPAEFEVVGAFTPDNMELDDSPALKAWLELDSTLQPDKPRVEYYRPGRGA